MVCDVLIVGGGPAGASLAILLAQQNWRVVLVDHGRGRCSGPYETLLAPGRTMLSRTGLSAAIEACSEVDPLRHGAIWGTSAVAWRSEGEPGLLLRRGAFDRRLCEQARRVGVDVRMATMVTCVGDEWQLATTTGGERLRPNHVVLATGRTTRAVGEASAVAAAPRSLAFTFTGTPHRDDRGTALVEAVGSGWIWTHAPHDGVASAAVIVHADELRAVGRERLLARALAESGGAAGRLGDRQLANVSDATPRLRPALPGVLRIGDAAATIDPLASQGVEKALAAADHAAAVLTAARAQPDWWLRLCEVHARWERGLFDAHADVAAAWYRREQRFAEHAFWRARLLPVEERTPPSFSQWFVVSPQLLRAQVLVREGHTFVERSGFSDQVTGEQATHCGYVPIEPLLAQFATARSLAAAVAGAGQDARLFVLPPRAVLAAMLQLVQRGWLRAATNAAGVP